MTERDHIDIELLYCGQPTDDPPTIGRFLDRIDLRHLEIGESRELRLVVSSSIPRKMWENLGTALKEDDATILVGVVQRLRGNPEFEP